MSFRYVLTRSARELALTDWDENWCGGRVRGPHQPCHGFLAAFASFARKMASKGNFDEIKIEKILVPRLRMVTYYTPLERARKELSNGSTADFVS